MTFADLLRRANLQLVTGSGKSESTFGNPKPKFSTHSFGCHFVEVTWQPEIARSAPTPAVAKTAAITPSVNAMPADPTRSKGLRPRNRGEDIDRAGHQIDRRAHCSVAPAAFQSTSGNRK